MPATLKLLVVDDDRFMLSLLRQTLQAAGYEVHAVDSGHQALRLANAVRFDLILLDASMPVLDGFEVLKHLKGNPALKNTPVLMLTALSSAADVQRASKSGAIGYITKPFRPDRLLTRIAMVFEGKVNKAGPETKAAEAPPVDRTVHL